MKAGIPAPEAAMLPSVSVTAVPKSKTSYIIELIAVFLIATNISSHAACKELWIISVVIGSKLTLVIYYLEL